jgi:hypothetical protein
LEVRLAGVKEDAGSRFGELSNPRRSVAKFLAGLLVFHLKVSATQSYWLRFFVLPGLETAQKLRTGSHGSAWSGDALLTLPFAKHAWRDGIRQSSGNFSAPPTEAPRLILLDAAGVIFRHGAKPGVVPPVSMHSVERLLRLTLFSVYRRTWTLEQ